MRPLVKFISPVAFCNPAVERTQETGQSLVGLVEIISSDLTDVMRRVEPSQVITEQSQFLTININLNCKNRERERERERAVRFESVRQWKGSSSRQWQ